MNDRTESRVNEIRRRTRKKRLQHENRVLSVLALVNVFFAVNLCAICGVVKEPGISVVAGSSGSVLLRSGTSAYVVTAIAAFCLGVIVTAICIRYKNRQQRSRKTGDEEKDIL